MLIAACRKLFGVRNRTGKHDNSQSIETKIHVMNNNSRLLLAMMQCATRIQHAHRTWTCSIHSCVCCMHLSTECSSSSIGIHFGIDDRSSGQFANVFHWFASRSPCKKHIKGRHSHIFHFVIIHSSMPQLIRNDVDLFRDRPLSVNEECAVNREFLSFRENAFDWMQQLLHPELKSMVYAVAAKCWSAINSFSQRRQSISYIPNAFRFVLLLSTFFPCSLDVVRCRLIYNNDVAAALLVVLRFSKIRCPGNKQTERQMVNWTVW